MKHVFSFVIAILGLILTLLSLRYEKHEGELVKMSLVVIAALFCAYILKSYYSYRDDKRKAVDSQKNNDKMQSIYDMVEKMSFSANNKLSGLDTANQDKFIDSFVRFYFEFEKLDVNVARNLIGIFGDVPQIKNLQQRLDNTIDSLAVYKSEESSISLSWLSPPAPPLSYDIRWSYFPINESNFNEVVQASTATIKQLSGKNLKGEWKSLEVKDLKPCTKYYFALKAKYDFGDTFIRYGSTAEGQTKGCKKDTEKPTAIKDLQAFTTNVNTGIDFKWTATSDNVKTTNYDLRWSTTPITDKNFLRAKQLNFNIAPQEPGTEENLRWTVPPEATKYYFALKTSDADGNWSDISNIAEFVNFRVTSKPATPQNVAAIPGNGIITLTWKLSLSSSEYSVYCNTEKEKHPSFWQKISTGTSNIFVHAGLTNGMPYQYRVTAKNQFGESEPSHIVSAIPRICDKSAGIPQNVKIVSYNSANVISWSRVENVLSYRIYWSSNSNLNEAEWNLIDDICSINYTHTDLQNNRTYSYMVTALDTTGEGSFSEIVSGRPSTLYAPLPPTSLVANCGSDARLSWNESAGAISYSIYWGTTEGFKIEREKVIRDVIKPPYFFKGLTEGQMYYFVVTAVGGGGESGPSVKVALRR